MKGGYRKLLGLSLIIALSSLTGCLEERPLPSEEIVKIYDSNLQETRELSPLDTLWVQVSGLAPYKFYTVEVLDPDGNVITKMTTQTNEEGVIAASPLWYEVGLTNNGTVDTSEELSLRSFYIHVKDEEGNTDFKQPFYIVYKTDVDETKSPKPIVYACLENGTMENAFEETGTKTLDETGNLIDSPKTKVYVKAENLRNINKADGSVTATAYVVPFNGEPIRDGEDLEEEAVLKTEITLNCTLSTMLCKTDSPQLVWDLNGPVKLINPKEGEGVYRLVIDLDNDGKFDLGQDVDGDGKIDVYQDGVDGASVAGFIVKNTSANDLQYKITDALGNTIDTIEEANGTNAGTLYLHLYNLPVNNGDSVHICLTDSVPTVGDSLSCVEETSAIAQEKENYYLPVAENVEIISTKDSSSSVYYDKDISEKKDFSVVVDLNGNGSYDEGDLLIADGVKVGPSPEPTYSLKVVDEYGTETRFFNETGSSSGTKVYVKVENTESENVNVYLFKPQDWEDGYQLVGYLLKKEIPADNSTQLFWDLNEDYKVINPTAENNAYDIVVDMDGDGYYNSTIDKKETVFIRDTEVNNLPQVSYTNIASGGMYRWYYDNGWKVDWDYRDVFDIYASNTFEGHYGATRGVKTVWNPLYDSWYRQSTENLGDSSSLYYGKWVDVYIVDADEYKLWNIKTKRIDGSKTGSYYLDQIDVRGHKTTLPVQWSCSNGFGQQTVWHPLLKPGRYYLIVDVDRDGMITEGVDIIDAVNEKGQTIKDNPNIVGFSVE